MPETRIACRIEVMSNQEKSGYGAQIKKYREAAGLLQSDVARHFGISPQAVQQWESDDTVPRGRRLAELAKILKCTVSDLMFGNGIKYIEETRQLLLEGGKLAEPSEKYGVPCQDAHTTGNKVPVFRWPRQSESEQLISFMYCPRDCKPGTVAYLIEDSSAAPDYLLRDVIYIEPSDEPDSGKAVVYRLNDGRTVLRVAECDGLNTYLKPINPAWPDQIYQVTDGDKLIGIVLGKWVAAK